ncbi:MAG TPA: adenylate/guanylate cyclase domain-containing protein [Vicinamibacteria bacterium]|nr:adenylate/guanylate cyclase domain-containing protein [Vicinamibacteria bacterium]
MESANLYLKDPQTTRFLSGGLAELESLFGAPLPTLPQADLESGRQVFYVKFHTQFRTLLVRWLQSLLREIGCELPTNSSSTRAEGSAGREAAEFQAAVERMLKAVRLAERRHGLLNLFWLAHTLDLAEALREIEARAPAVKKAKYSLHPLLSSFYRRADQAVRRSIEQQSPGRTALLTGVRENTGLVGALLDDGFAFTELSISDFDFNPFLANNKRYRLGPELFFEIYSVLFRETERRVREGDRGLLARINRYMPALTKEHLQTQAGMVKVMMNGDILGYLLADAWCTGARLIAVEKLKAEAQKRRSAEIMEAFTDVLAGVKRFEVISHLRSHVALVRGFGEGQGEEASNRRLFEFGDSAQVLNNAVNATVLFLDLRGFTQTSEGHISERDLTQELYTVFDAFVPHVLRFGGTVDKFLGDGMMITWGTRRVDPLDPLNAVRTAVLCQETLSRLRREGKTVFRMGIAIHYGRVYVARFIADEDSVQTTVIGRNVNLAGRLSSAAKKPMDVDEGSAAPAAQRGDVGVTVDASGTLFNEGIALSRDALQQLEANLPLVHREGEGTTHVEYFDEQIGRRLFMRYAGDAKFKGVRSSFPVYEVDFVR